MAIRQLLVLTAATAAGLTTGAAQSARRTRPSRPTITGTWLRRRPKRLLHGTSGTWAGVPGSPRFMSPFASAYSSIPVSGTGEGAAERWRRDRQRRLFGRRRERRDRPVVARRRQSSLTCGNRARAVEARCRRGPLRHEDRGLVENPDRLGLHHATLRVPDPEVSLKFYLDVFGGQRVKLRGTLDAVDYGNLYLIIEKGNAAPSFGRAIDHLGWRPANIDVTVADMKARGVKFVTQLENTANAKGHPPVLRRRSGRGPHPDHRAHGALEKALGCALTGEMMGFLTDDERAELMPAEMLAARDADSDADRIQRRVHPTPQNERATRGGGRLFASRHSRPEAGARPPAAFSKRGRHGSGVRRDE